MVVRAQFRMRRLRPLKTSLKMEYPLKNDYNNLL